MKKKILFVYPEMMMGGSTTSLVNLLNEINYEKYEVDIVFRKTRGELLKFLPKEVNVLKPLDKFPNNFFGKLLKIFLLIFNNKFYKYIYYKLIKKVKNQCSQISAYYQVSLCRKIAKQYDVAISFLEGFANAYLNSNKVRANKKISWIHIDYQKAGFDIKHDYRCLSKSNNIAFVSQNCMNNFEKIAPSLSDKLIVVENIVSYKLLMKKAQEYNITDDNIISRKNIKLLTVCRLDTQTKGLDRILNIITKLRQKGYNFFWYLIGGNADKEFIELYDKFIYKENLILLGEKINPFPYYKYFDAFVLASRFEGKPMVITESIMLNLPVIVTEYSSAKEQIIQWNEGIIVENSESALCNTLENIFMNIETIKKMKEYLENKEYSINEKLIDFEKILDN